MRLLTDPSLLAAHPRMLPPLHFVRPELVDPALVIGYAKLQAADGIDSALRAMGREGLVVCLTNASAVDRLVQFGRSWTISPIHRAALSAAALAIKLAEINVAKGPRRGRY